MLVSDFKESFYGSYPDLFLDSLPSKCLNESCGSPTEISTVLTGLKCSNPRCPSKVIRRIGHIMQDMGVKDFGPSRISDFVVTYGIRNPLAVFAYEPSDGNLGSGISEKLSEAIYAQIKAKKNFTLWEYVRVANLPYIQSSALTLFGEFDDLESAYAEIVSGGVDYIRDKLGIAKGVEEDGEILLDEFGDLDVSTKNVSVRALKIFEVLMTFKQDLFEFISFVNIIPLHSSDIVTLKAVCSDEVGVPFSTKADFYSTINGLYSDVHVEFLKTVNKEIDYLVWAGAENSAMEETRKVKTIKGYNEKFEMNKASGKVKDGEHYIPIVSAMQFMGILENISKSRLESKD